MKLEDLEIYQLAKDISKEAWTIYKSLDWKIQKVNGDQFITAIDSIGANIAEGWGRFHFLDRNRFNYNARASLIESIHWLNLIAERQFITTEKGADLLSKLDKLHLKLNNYINSTKKQKQISQ